MTKLNALFPAVRATSRTEEERKKKYDILRMLLEDRQAIPGMENDVDSVREHHERAAALVHKRLGMPKDLTEKLLTDIYDLDKRDEITPCDDHGQTDEDSDEEEQDYEDEEYEDEEYEDEDEEDDDEDDCEEDEDCDEEEDCDDCEDSQAKLIHTLNNHMFLVSACSITVLAVTTMNYIATYMMYQKC